MDQHVPLPATHVFVTKRVPCAHCGHAFVAGDTVCGVPAKRRGGPIDRVIGTREVFEIVHVACMPAAFKSATARETN